MKGSDHRYGSKYHFQWYRDNDCEGLDNAFKRAIDPQLRSLSWLYPTSPASAEEPTGISFLPPSSEIRKAWIDFWPPTGTPLSWDGIAESGSPSGKEWLIVEAKANHPEFSSPPSGAGAIWTRSFASARRLMGCADSVSGSGPCSDGEVPRS